MLKELISYPTRLFDKKKKETISTYPRFSQKEGTRLEKEGNMIITLTGKTYKELMEASPDRFPINQTQWLYLMSKEIFDTPSLITELAFNPDNFILEESNQKTLAAQLCFMKDQKSHTLGKIPLSVLGFPEYMEIMSQYLSVTEKYLISHGREIRTTSQIGDYTNCNIAVHYDTIHPSLSYNCIPWKNLFIAPVYVPKETLS